MGLAGRRLPFLDALSGVAILRMLLVHAKSDFFSTALGRNEWLPQQSPGMRTIDTLLRFSVPIFVIVAGIRFGLGRGASGPGGLTAYVEKRADRLLRPFVLGTLLVIAFGRFSLSLQQRFGVPLVNCVLGGPATLVARLAAIDSPAYHLWFLLMLFLVAAVYPLVAAVIRRPVLRLLLLIGLYGLTVARPLPHPLPYLRYLLLYDVGVGIAGRYRASAGQPRSPPLLLAVCLATGLTGAYLRVMALHGPAAILAQALLETALPLAWMLAFERLPAGRTLERLARLGKLAWPVYFLHAPFILGNLGLLIYRGFGWVSPAVIPVLAAASLAVSLALYRVLERLRLARLIL